MLVDYDEVHMFNTAKPLKTAIQRATIKNTIGKSEQSSKNYSRNPTRGMEKKQGNKYQREETNKQTKPKK